MLRSRDCGTGGCKQVHAEARRIEIIVMSPEFALEADGWQVVEVWQCETRERAALAERTQKILATG